MKTPKLLALLSTLGIAPAFGDFVIQPATLTVNQGSILTVDVFANNATDLYAYQFDIGFNPAVLAADAVTEGPFLSKVGGTLFFAGLIDNTGGTISFIADTLTGPVSGANGSGIVAALTFTSVGVGASPIQFFNVSAYNSFGEGIITSTTDGAVTSDPVPEPSSLTLVVLVLAVGVFSTRRLAAHRI